MKTEQIINSTELSLDSLVSNFGIDKMPDFITSDIRKIPAGTFLKELINDGWLSLKVLQNVEREVRPKLQGFLFELSELIIDTKYYGLSEMELADLKSNVGLVSVNVLREGLRLRKK